MRPCSALISGQMMVQELLPFLPPASTTPQAVACVALMVAGALLWMAGALWSRGIVTLLAVALGGVLGMMLPRWQHWPLNSMSASVLGAVLLGTFAFITPRLWVGLLLGSVLCVWVALAAWIVCKGDQTWPWRSDWEVAAMSFPEHVQDMWSRLPEPVRRVLPYGAGTAMMSGLAMSALFPRLSRALCAASGGVTLMFFAGLTLVASRRPDWIASIPPGADVQAGVLVGMTLFSVMLQWQLLPSRKLTPATPEERAEKSKPNDAERYIASRKFV